MLPDGQHRQKLANASGNHGANDDDPKVQEVKNQINAASENKEAAREKLQNAMTAFDQTSKAFEQAVDKIDREGKYSEGIKIVQGGQDGDWDENELQNDGGAKPDQQDNIKPDTPAF